MEKFSDFDIDSLFDEKKTAKESSNYNDNIYNNSNNNIYSAPLTNIEYYMLSNLIIFEGLKKYYEDYKETTVPYSYIGFYLTELNKYTSMHSPMLKTFLYTFNKKRNNLQDSINIFTKTFQDYTEIKSIKKDSFFTGLKAGEYISVEKKFLNKTITNQDDNNKDLNNALKQISKIATTINETSADKKLKLLYIEYMSAEAPKKEKEESVAAITPVLPAELTSKTKKSVIAPPKAIKEEKISRIKIRRLTIGKIYPTSLTHSRIDSAFFAFKFVEGHTCFKIVEKYRFTKVKYTQGFETKRKELFEDKKSDFDLF